MHGHDRDVYYGGLNNSRPRTMEEAYPAAATAAVALAQLHNHRPDSDWEDDNVCILLIPHSVFASDLY